MGAESRAAEAIGSAIKFAVTTSGRKSIERVLR